MSTLFKLLLIWFLGNVITGRRRMEERRRQQGPTPQAQSQPSLSSKAPTAPVLKEETEDKVEQKPSLKEPPAAPAASVDMVDTKIKTEPVLKLPVSEPAVLVQSFMLMQALGEPRSRRPWRPR